MVAKKTALACGGKGPCCHIGYSHRHCGHCDVVIDTRPAAPWPYWWVNGIMSNPPLRQTWGTADGLGRVWETALGASQHATTTYANANDGTALPVSLHAGSEHTCEGNS